MLFDILYKYLVASMYNTDIDLPSGSESLVLITVRRVHYGDMGKAPTTSSLVCEELSG